MRKCAHDIHHRTNVIFCQGHAKVTLEPSNRLRETIIMKNRGHEGSEPHPLAPSPFTERGNKTEIERASESPAPALFKGRYFQWEDIRAGGANPPLRKAGGRGSSAPDDKPSG